MLRREFHGIHQEGVGGGQQGAALSNLHIPGQFVGVDRVIVRNVERADVFWNVEFERFADAGRHAGVERILAFFQAGLTNQEVGIAQRTSKLWKNQHLVLLAFNQQVICGVGQVDGHWLGGVA